MVKLSLTRHREQQTEGWKHIIAPSNVILYI